MNHVKTAAIVTVVSILIWVFAEGESLRSLNLNTNISITPPNATAVEVIEPEGFTGDIALALRGSTSAVGAIRDRLDEGVVLDQTNAIPTAPGDHVLNLPLVLRGAEPFVDSGVTIDKVDPESLRIRVVALQTLHLPVVVRAEAEFDGLPTANPDTVTIEVPTDLVATLPPGAGVIANLGADRLASVSLGTRQTIQSVRLMLPPQLEGKWGVSPPKPGVADVTLTLRDTTATATLTRVPVYIRLATSELGRWNIDVADPWLEDVTIRGPGDLVQRVADSMNPKKTVEGQRVVALAILDLSFEELEQGITSKEVEFVLRPNSAGSLQFSAPNPTVSFTVKRSQSTPDDASPPQP